MTDAHATDLYDAILELEINNSTLERLAQNQANAGFEILAAGTREQIARNNVAIAKLKAVVAEECEGVAR